MQRFRHAAGTLVFLFLLSLCLAVPAEAALTWVDPPDILRPGKNVRLSFTATLSGDADITVQDGNGAVIAAISENYPAKTGRNDLIWDGQVENEPLAPGSYLLTVTQGNVSASLPITVGEESPVLRSVFASDPRLVLGEDWHVTVETNLLATLLMTVRVEDADVTVFEEKLPSGTHDIPWDGTVNGQSLSPGSYTVTLTLRDDAGFSSNGEQFTVTVEEQASTSLADVISITESGDTPHSPSDFSSYTCSHESCFYKLPMGVLDEEAIWAAMMTPMTVVKGEQRAVVKIYAEPDKNSTAVGEVTCDSQGLHVIENLDNGWTLVEAYSSSIHTSKVKNWAGFFSGYIETSKLEVKQPNDKYGLLLDKLTQRMYVFQEGKIISELKISTGLVNSKQPYNETPAGEFMIVSWTGGFWSGNMFCDLALRVNGGILIHEVPCLIDDDGNRNYAYFEKLLGQKASHGCIRVQRELTEEGINMRWLWDNLKMNTRVFIWDDVGRNIPIPADDTPVYYNPDGGKYYHSDAYCSSVKDKYLPLQGFTYGELEDSPYDKLTPCPYCNPPKRKADIEALNEGNAVGN